MEKKLNNGMTYRFEEIFPNFIATYCFYDGKWNSISKNFHSWVEVNTWIEEMNEPMTYTMPVKMTANEYYSITGYYGD